MTLSGWVDVEQSITGKSSIVITGVSSSMTSFDSQLTTDIDMARNRINCFTFIDIPFIFIFISMFITIAKIILLLSVGIGLFLYFNVNPFYLKKTGRVPSLQQAIIIFSSFVHPFMMLPPCNAAYT